MGKLRSSPFVCFSSHSTAIISSISLCFVQRASIIFLFLNFTNVSGVKFDPPIQLPGSRTSQYVSNSSTVLYIHDFGARGNGMSDDTKAFQKAWKIACSLSSEAKIVVPAGKKFLVRPIDFSGPCRSGLTLWWKVEGRLMGVARNGGLDLARLITQIPVDVLQRISAPAHSPNTDGIHISASKNVEVKDCIIRTGDDCISIVSNSSKILVEGITCGPGHGISIGSLGKSNSRDQVHDVKVNGANLTNTENGVRIKTWQGGSGFASGITFQNVWMENVSNPIIINQYYCDSFVPCANQTSAVSINKISFVGIKGTSATETAVSFACSDSSPCRMLYLEDVQLTSYTGEITTSFCWQAYGSSSGLVYPPSCLLSSCNNRIIQQQAESGSIQSI
ncbi:probable polygalacturonase At1g80170 isoform X3 [Coffea arabica]|uniref:Probable polygalacturonase At1g80170 isoform X3 n=1 Tax=Coffea arabica TaxID=13443 RepID=A0ABM4U7K3_COFAR